RLQDARGVQGQGERGLEVHGPNTTGASCVVGRGVFTEERGNMQYHAIRRKIGKNASVRPCSRVAGARGWCWGRALVGQPGSAVPTGRPGKAVLPASCPRPAPWEPGLSAACRRWLHADHPGRTEARPPRRGGAGGDPRRSRYLTSRKRVMTKCLRV